MTGNMLSILPSKSAPGGLSAAVAIADTALRDRTLGALQGAGVNLLGDFSALPGMAELVAAIGRVQPDLLLLGFDGLPLDTIEAIRQIRALEASPRVAVVNGSANPEIILQAMRAGASEFLYPPLEEQIPEAVARLAAECAKEGTRRAGGNLIGILSAKGGCGGTTLACHVAGYLDRRFKKHVLLADLDFCSGNAGLLMGCDQRYHVLDALDHLNRLDATLWKSLVATTTEGPDFIAAPAEPAELAGRMDSLAALLRFWRLQYDYTVVDLGHGLTPATCGLLDAFDSLLLVTTGEMPALRLAKQTLGLIEKLKPGGTRPLLVINRIARRAPIQIPELERIMGAPIYASIPNEYQLLTEAHSQAKLLDPDSSLGKAIAALAAKLAGTEAAPKKARRLALFG
jgi:pilus assembly protein CpaE